MSNTEKYRLIGIAVERDENPSPKYKPWAYRYDKNFKRAKLKCTGHRLVEYDNSTLLKVSVNGSSYCPILEILNNGTLNLYQLKDSNLESIFKLDRDGLIKLSGS